MSGGKHAKQFTLNTSNVGGRAALYFHHRQHEYYRNTAKAVVNTSPPKSYMAYPTALRIPSAQRVNNPSNFNLELDPKRAALNAAMPMPGKSPYAHKTPFNESNRDVVNRVAHTGTPGKDHSRGSPSSQYGSASKRPMSAGPLLHRSQPTGGLRQGLPKRAGSAGPSPKRPLSAVSHASRPMSAVSHASHVSHASSASYDRPPSAPTNSGHWNASAQGQQSQMLQRTTPNSRISRYNLAAPEVQVYEDFVRLLGLFDKNMMLDLVEDSLKDAQEQKLLSGYGGTEWSADGTQDSMHAIKE